MINEITITDIFKAESYAFSNKKEYDIWISAVDEQDLRKVNRIGRLLNEKKCNHFYELFYDWSDEDNDIFIQKNIEKMGPQRFQVENIINFLKPFVEDKEIHNLGVNCFAGVSRSTAIAIIASVMAGKTPKMALDYVLSVRPMAWPNLRILRFGSDILGQNILKEVQDWKNINKQTLYVA